mgnify:FL=1
MAKNKDKKGKRGKKKQSSGPSFFDKMLKAANDQIVTVSEVRLQKIIDARKGKVDIINPLIKSITSNSIRVDSNNYKTKDNEFVYRDGKVLKRGIYYHIHYTNDLNEYYMTGTSHAGNSKIIKRIKNNTDFEIYNLLNKQSILTIPSARVVPTEKDYEGGYIRRYFARKTNNPQSPVFEILKNYYQKSPLYDYAGINWMITGPKNKVEEYNQNQIELASEKIPSLTKLLSPFQMYRRDDALNPKESIMDKLNLKDPSELTALDFFATNRSNGKKKRKGKGSKTKTKSNTSTTSTGGASTSSGGSSGGSYGGSSGGSSGGGGGGY